jgi:hypothetical protein
MAANAIITWVTSPVLKTKNITAQRIISSAALTSNTFFMTLCFIPTTWQHFIGFTKSNSITIGKRYTIHSKSYIIHTFSPCKPDAGLVNMCE